MTRNFYLTFTRNVNMCTLLFNLVALYNEIIAKCYLLMLLKINAIRLLIEKIHK